MNRRSNIYIPNVLSPTECWQFISDASALPAVNADMGQNTEFPEIRSSTVRWVYNNDPKFAWIFDRLTPMIRATNATSFGFAIDDIEALQYTEYHGDRRGLYDYHIDLFMMNDTEKDRKLSFVIQLSDPSAYYGGDLHIHCEYHPDPATMRLQGGMIVFPSFLEHAVSPVTQGLRYSLVGWVLGSRFT